MVSMLPRELHNTMTIASFLGQPIISASILGCIAVWAWDEKNTKLVIAGASGGAGIVVNSLLKFWLGRQRPATHYVKNMWFDTFSFPSGHSAGSLIAYGLLIYLAWHLFPIPLATCMGALGIVLLVLVGVSRIYLGAHYPSDVLGGWGIGGVTLLAIITIVRPFA
jgi:undecaprenyl-diphosphatase